MMITTLIAKDLARLRTNWAGPLVLLAMPLCITALVGTVFGPAANRGELPRIKLAIVNEDDNVVGGMLAGIASHEGSRKYLDPVVVDREEALQMLNANQLSGVIIVPSGFSDIYLAGGSPPAIQLVKNPAQRYLPAITEELLRVVAELLDAVSQNLFQQLPELQQILSEPGAPDMMKLTKVVTYIGERLGRAEAYLYPPIIGLTSDQPSESGDSADATDQLDTTVSSKPANKQTSKGPTTKSDVFSFVLPPLVSLFLLFVAEGAARELFTELRLGTLQRYRTLHSNLLPMLTAKAIYGFVLVLASALIMLIGGGWVFGITWRAPLQLSALTISLAIFSVGFAQLLVSLVLREQLASLFNTVIIMLIGFAGGSMIPAHQLPAFLRNVVGPLLPNYMYAESIKRLQLGLDGPHWASASLQLSVVGAAMLVISAILLQRKLRASSA